MNTEKKRYKMRKQFGKKAKPSDFAIYAKSNAWKGKAFWNISETKMDIGGKNFFTLLKEQFKTGTERSPKQPIPIENFSVENLQNGEMIWLGHSVVILKLADQLILIDPMFGEDASPIAPFKTKRFSKDTLQILDSISKIDLVLISHDHYDHLDLKSIQKLKDKTTQFITGLGICRHLKYWDVSESKISELDWWQNIEINGLTITYTPTRHFSGRGALDRGKTLWGGFALKTANENIFFSGDGGYDEHFKEIGQRLGPFDFGFMECGQYHPFWHQIHMYPEESVQAAQDAKVMNTIPVHWAGFKLALHPWTEPVEKYTKAALKADLNFTTPRIGAVFTIQNKNQEKWWK